jgi:hypothetical protein
LVDTDPLVVDAHLTRPDGQVAGERQAQLRTPRADQPGERDHLTGVHPQRDVADLVGGQAVDREHDLVGGHVLAGVHGAEVAPDHHAHHPRLVGLRGVDHADHRAVAQYRHPVGHLEDLGEPVRDVDDGAAVVAQPPDELEQRLDLLLGDGRGRFVERDDPRLGGQRAQDLHELALGRGEAPAQRVGVEHALEADAGQVRLNLPAKSAAVEEPAGFTGQRADVDVLRD